MIVVTTPTGSIGRQVAERLVGDGRPVRVVARDASKLSDTLRGKAEVVEGSHGDAATAEAAFAGADAVFWLVPPQPKAQSVLAAYLDFTLAACEALRGVGRVVGVSALGWGTRLVDRAGLVTASVAMDRVIAATGVPYRALTMPSFMDNLLRQAKVIREQGLFFGPIDGDRKLPTCATRDIAAAAVDWLTDASWTGFDRVPVLGPEDLSFNEMAQILSDVLGRPVQFRQTTLDQVKGQMTANGMGEAMAQGYVDMMAAKSAGMDNAEARTPAGTTPTSFRQWCEEELKPAVLNG